MLLKSAIIAGGQIFNIQQQKVKSKDSSSKRSEFISYIVLNNSEIQPFSLEGYFTFHSRWCLAQVLLSGYS